MKKPIHHDIYVGILMIAINIFGFYRTTTMPKGSDMFPQLLFTFFSAFALYILIKGIIETKKMRETGEKDTISAELLKLPMLTLGIVVIYTVAVKFLGFFVSTIIFIPSFMVFYRYKKYLNMLITVVGVMIFIYFTFVKQLHVQFPTGLLF